VETEEEKKEDETTLEKPTEVFAHPTAVTGICADIDSLNAELELVLTNLKDLQKDERLKQDIERTTKYYGPNKHFDSPSKKTYEYRQTGNDTVGEYAEYKRNTPAREYNPIKKESPILGYLGDMKESQMREFLKDKKESPLKNQSLEKRETPIKDILREKKDSPLKEKYQDKKESPIGGYFQEKKESPYRDILKARKEAPITAAPQQPALGMYQAKKDYSSPGLFQPGTEPITGVYQSRKEPSIAGAYQQKKDYTSIGSIQTKKETTEKSRLQPNIQPLPSTVYEYKKYESDLKSLQKTTVKMGEKYSSAGKLTEEPARTKPTSYGTTGTGVGVGIVTGYPYSYQPKSKDTAPTQLAGSYKPSPITEKYGLGKKDYGTKFGH